MSRQLAFAAALSVMLMAGYALYEPHAAGAQSGASASLPGEVSAPALPSLPRLSLLPR